MTTLLQSKPGITPASVLSIPKDWNAAWFKEFIGNQLKGADVRNATGAGCVVSGTIATPYATITVGGTATPGKLPITLSGTSPASFAIDINGQVTMTVGNTFQNLTLANASSGGGSNVFLNLTNLSDAAMSMSISQVGAGTKFANIMTNVGLNLPLNIGTNAVTRMVIAASNTSSVSINDDTGTLQPVGLRRIAPNNTPTANYSLQLSDRGSQVLCGNAITVTIPAGVFAPGDYVYINNLNTTGVHPITVAAGAGASLFWADGSGVAKGGNRTLAYMGWAIVVRYSGETWLINGTGIT